MRTSQLTAPVQPITALLLCVTISMAAQATAPGVARPPAQAAAPPAFPAAIGRQSQHTPIQMQAAKPLPALPLVVLSHGRPFQLPPTLPAGFSAAAYERAWQAGQNGLARLEPGTPHIIARASNHYIQLQQPELVIRAVRQVIQKAR